MSERFRELPKYRPTLVLSRASIPQSTQRINYRLTRRPAVRIPIQWEPNPRRMPWVDDPRFGLG